MNIRISNVDGTYRDVTFKINIRARSIKINVTAPKNIIYDGNSYTATVKCYDLNGGELTDAVPIIRYGKDNLSSVTDAGTYYIDVYHANWGNDNKVYVTRFTKEQFYSYFQVFQSVQDPS